MRSPAPRILLVEDERELNAIIAEQLEREGYAITRVHDGIAAVEAFTSSEFDAIILDWMLPGLDGIGVLTRLRRERLTPVLMLTARGTDMDIVNGLEAGADDYLVKPVHVRVLRARVRALLRRGRPAASDVAPSAEIIEVNDLVLDVGARTAHAAGTPLHLSPTEFDLLALFAANPGRAFSRDYLIERLWPDDAEISHRAVDTNILRLRKKLGPSGDVIRTVWGMGYRLEADRPE